MEHLAIMTKGYIENILSGKKKIESRFSKNRIAPFHTVSEGDTVYLQEVGKEVSATFEIDRVLYFENLSENKIDEIRNQFGKDICADEEFWNLKKNSKYATLIFIKNPVKIAPFKVYKRDRSAFKSVNSVKEDLSISKRKILKHPHNCENNQHYFIYDGITHCRFCNFVFLHSDLMKQKPDYKTIKRAMKESMWNDEWLNAELDSGAKTKLNKIKIAEIKKILNKSIRIERTNDGRQTPYYGNPVYYAQHGLGCCCRKCLEKFYGIPKDRVLSDDDLEYFANLIIDYLKEKRSNIETRKR